MTLALKMSFVYIGVRAEHTTVFASIYIVSEGATWVATVTLRLELRAKSHHGERRLQRGQNKVTVRKYTALCPRFSLSPQFFLHAPRGHHGLAVSSVHYSVSLSMMTNSQSNTWMEMLNICINSLSRSAGAHRARPDSGKVGKACITHQKFTK